MRGAGRQPQPRALRERAALVGERAFERRIARRRRHTSTRPRLAPGDHRSSRIESTNPACEYSGRTATPARAVGCPGGAGGAQCDVLARAPRKLPQLHEQHAALARKRRVAKPFGVQEIGAGRPIAVLVGEHALEHEDLFAVRMLVRMKRRARLVAHDRRHLSRLDGADEVHALAPHRTARARRPVHRRRIDGDARAEIAVDRNRSIHPRYVTRSRSTDATNERARGTRR